MANYLISTMPAVGHVNPILLTAARLVERGHQVWWHTERDAAAKVEATGARFVPMRHSGDVVESVRAAEQKKGPAAASAAVIALFVTPMLGQLHDYEAILSDFPADALLVDMCSLGAALLRERGGPVWASVGINPLRTADSPFYGSGQMPALTPVARLGNRTMNWLANHLILRGVHAAFREGRRRAGLPPPGKLVFDYLTSPYLHLQGTTPAFEFPYRNLAPQIHFVGPMLSPMPADYAPPPWWDELQTGRPVVHVTQGTVATDTAELVQPTIAALAGADVLVVVTTAHPEQLGVLPPNVRVERLIPHSLLLPHVDVMVTNGGYNGVKTALAYGVPLVAAGASEDKPEVCSRIAWSGAGVNLKTGSPTPDQLRQAVNLVLHDPAYRERARAIQAEFAGCDSPTECAQLLERLAQTNGPVYRS